MKSPRQLWLKLVNHQQTFGSNSDTWTFFDEISANFIKITSHFKEKYVPLVSKNSKVSNQHRYFTTKKTSSIFSSCIISVDPLTSLYTQFNYNLNINI